MKIVKFKKVWVGEDDDTYEVVVIEPRVSRDAFIECLKNGAVKKIENVWDWDEKKAKPILEKHGYKVITIEEQEKEERRRMIESEIEAELQKPETYIDTNGFEKEHYGASYSSFVKVKKVLSEEVIEKEIEKEGIKMKGKAQILIVEGEQIIIDEDERKKKEGKFMIVKIDDKVYFKLIS